MCLDFIDLLGSPIYIEIDKRKKVKTNIGGLLTILIFLIFLVSLWVIGNDLVYKKKPFSYQKQIYHDIFPNLSLNHNSFPFAFSLEDVDGNPIKTEGYLNITLEYNRIASDDFGKFIRINQTFIEFGRCNYSNFPNFPKTKFDSNKVFNHFCPLNYENDLLVSGSYTEKQNSFFVFNVYMCNYEIYSFCKNRSEISSFIRDNYISFSIYYLDSIVDVENYNQPLKFVLNSIFSTLVPELNKNINIFVGEDSLVTDQGILAENYSETNFLNIKNNALDTFTFSEYDKVLFSMYIYSYNISTRTIRNYVTLTEVIARITGFLSVLIFVFQFINSYFCELDRNLNLLNLFQNAETKAIKNHSINEKDLSANISNLRYFNINPELKNKSNSLNKINIIHYPDLNRSQIKINSEEKYEYRGFSFREKLILIFSKIFGFKINRNLYLNHYIEQQVTICKYFDVKKIVNFFILFENFTQNEDPRKFKKK